MARRLLKDGVVQSRQTRRHRGAVVQASLSRHEPGFHGHALGREYLSGLSSMGGAAGGCERDHPAYCPSSSNPSSSTRRSRSSRPSCPGRCLPWPGCRGRRAAARSELKALMALHQLCALFPTRRHWIRWTREALACCFERRCPRGTTDDTLIELERVLGLNTADVLRYADRKRPAPHRQAAAPRGRRPRRVDRFVLAGDTRAEAWIKTLLEGEHPPAFMVACCCRGARRSWLFRRAARWCAPLQCGGHHHRRAPGRAGRWNRDGKRRRFLWSDRGLASLQHAL
jgi:assimilatory nitrate reductase catalytic subunit